ncbi:unnamed protein product [Lactuca virosa]|uniref:Epidermal patterning factor-like protein n=1 Tax=Lactuca virosa TaxID=75947 RepID=A0AAU9P3C6_9ASTR|nr:unnamed protein product [Lactuca virosa]
MNHLFSSVLLASCLLLMGHGDAIYIVKHRADTLQIAGSRLPDCLHACGSCSPCHLVRVRFICSVGPAEAETCPIAYKCMCSNKTYHVP